MRVVTDEASDRLSENVGFRRSFEAFYASELKAVVGLAYVLSGSRSGAEDLAQQGFLAAYREWDRISGYDETGAWVRRVVANRAVSGFRRARVETRASIRLASDRLWYPNSQRSQKNCGRRCAAFLLVRSRP